MANKQKHLVLVFTQGVSLAEWVNVGMFDREIALYQRLAEAGLNITLVTWGGAEDKKYVKDIPGIEVACNAWNLSDRWYTKAIPWLHRGVFRNADVIKTNQTPGSLVALAAAEKFNKPLNARCGYLFSDFEANAAGVDSARACRAREMEDKVFNRAKAVTVTTQAMRDTIQQRYGIAPERIRIHPNFIQTDSFYPQADRQADVDVIAVGRLSEQKHPELLLQALRHLPGVKARFIGAGPKLAALEETFADVMDRVDFAGNVPNAALPEQLNRARCYVMCSRYEGHPKALLEAMACGLPVIGTRVPGIENVIHHLHDGLLCDETPTALAGAIDSVLQNRRLAESLGSQAARRIQNELSLDRIVEMEVELFDALTGRQSSSVDKYLMEVSPIKFKQAA